MPPENLSSFVLSQKPRTWILRFNRPEARNAINRALLVELNKVLDAAAKDNELAMIVLEGDKKFFCSGMDFRELTGALASGAGGQDIEAYTSLYMKT
ncbi:MAG: enoyl-CoA hydratase/isomerase family protein, partial [Spirochaetia bacterium]|nr:enoyl-CoA hydratase/isomerase family protein [Spirochaetia bacterium]